MITEASLGFYKHQKISKVTPTGCYIEVSEGTAFLPSSETQTLPNEGDEVEVFIYHNYDGHLTATTKRPYITVGQTEVLRIKAAGDQGAFADWGLEKDLFIPFAEQTEVLQKGMYYLIHAYIDEKSERIAGSTKIDKFIPDIISLDTVSSGDEVVLKIFKKTDLGYKALVNNDFTGMLYENELTQPVETGMTLTGYIKIIRDDGKVDLTLRKQGYDEVLDATDVILEKLKKEDGQLPFHDKSDPEEIRENFKMSKRTFKAAVGALLKSGKIELTDSGIKLKNIAE